MKALVLNDVNDLKIDNIDNPIANDDEVVVAVRAVGICGSDIPRSYKDGAHNMPLIIGHEFAGEVIKASGANEHLLGKRVGVFPLIPCRKCTPCRNHQYEMCKSYSYLGSRRNGGFAELVIVPIWNLIEIPDSISFEEAAMLEPMAVATHAMRRVTINNDDTVCVCGLGTIGMLLVMLLRDKGVKNILVIGNKDFQKKKIEQLGVEDNNFCDSRTTSPNDFINDRTNGEGVNVFFECVGSNTTINMAVDNVAAAGKVCLVGNPHSDISFDKNTYWKILRNQLTVVGTWNSSYQGDNTEDDWHYVIDRLAQGTISPAELITHRYDLDDITNGFEIMRDKSEDYIKIMCVMER